MDREELAWAAGFFDGEGCFSYTEAANYACVSIWQTSREPLDRFRESVTVGKVYGPYKNTSADRWSKKPLYLYRAHGHERVQAIMAMLWFKLGSVKRAQALPVLYRAT